RHDYGGGGGQTFGNDGDGEGDAQKHQGLPRPAPSCKAYRHDDDAHRKPYDGEDLAHGVELFLDGRLEGVLLFEDIGALAHLGVRTRRRDNAHRVAVHYDGGGICHVDPVSEGSVGGKHRIRVLFGGDGFAREGRLLHAQIVVRDEPHVGGDDRAVL